MATPELPGVCPSCGKENPPASPVCHFCGASATSRIRLSAMGLGIALLLVITAVHFYQAATYRPDYAPLAALTAERNFERVRVKGRITDIRVIRQQYDHHQVRIEIQGEDAGEVADYLRAEMLAPGNILLDPESELMRLTGARALPTTLFFDADGRLRRAHMGELSRATLEARLRELQ